MNAIRNVSSQFIRNPRSILLQFNRFASDTKAIEDLTKKSKVVVFMKVCFAITGLSRHHNYFCLRQGNPEAPKCGFSNAVVQIMRMHGVKYDSYDVLLDEELRKGIKDFSNWPTIPQVFISGEFVGGCDILLQMHQNGELIDVLQKSAGIKSALAEESAATEKPKN